MTQKDHDTQMITFANDLDESLINHINHAFKTPLNGLSGMVELLAKSGLASHQLKYARIVREAAYSLQLQLNNLMELAQSNGPISAKAANTGGTSYRLADIIKEALQPIITPAVKKGVSLSLQCDPDLPDVITTDLHKLRLLLVNILSCAVKLTEEEHITLNITQAAGQKNHDNQNITLRFAFSGCTALYDALQTSINEYKDHASQDLLSFGELTVCLLTVQHILQGLGAQLALEPDEKDGIFAFEITVQTAADTLNPTIYSSLFGKRALLLEDAHTPRPNLLTQSLHLWGIKTTTIDHEDLLLPALDHAAESNNAIDIVFISAVLEGRKLAALKEKVPHLVIITAEPSLNTAWLNEFSAHFVPPLYPDELITTLSSLYIQPPLNEHNHNFAAEASQLINNTEYHQMPARIMLVEDDSTNRLYATELLESFGCQVAIAENGQQALARLDKNADYDLVLMDCMMPIMDGYTATQHIRNKGLSDLPVIALTANTMENERQKCLDAGMNDYMTKPIREQALYELLKRYTQ